MKNARAIVFTMVELLVVISIIMILASLLFPALKKSRDTAKAIVCCGNLKQVGVAELSYSNDYNGWSTPMNELYTGGASCTWVWHSMLSNNKYLPVSKVDKPSLVVCPSIPPYFYKNIEFAYGRLYGTNYQPYKIGGGDVIGAWNSYNYGPPSRFFLAVDSTLDNNTSASHLNQYYFFANYTGSLYKVGARHNKCANILFADGHVKALNQNSMTGGQYIYLTANHIYVGN